MPLNLEQMLKILSPVRPKQIRAVSGLGSLAAELRGGRQPAGQLLNQLSQKPGVKQGALQQLLGHVDPGAKMTPEDLATQVRSPKLFAQRGISSGQQDEEYLLMDLAGDLVYGPEMHAQREEIVRQILEDLRPRDDIGLQNLLRNRHWTPEQFTDAENTANQLLKQGEDTGINDVYMDELADQALYMVRESEGPSGKSMVPAYGEYQRQPGLTNDGYFETVLRGTPSRGRELGAPTTESEYHFLNPSQLGHVRGTVMPDRRVYAEELQSDPLEWLGNSEGVPSPGELEGIYGKLGRMLIDRSAEAQAPSVSFPDANRIASVRRGSSQQFFRDVYDKQLAKQLYDPLAKRGVPLRQENGWTTMELPEGILNAIKNEGLLNYKRGGRVR